MSRLDAFIRRMQAQRACIDAAAANLGGLTGPILELGLGNGRTYDHLRVCFPDRPIYVFDRQVAAHPDCIPPAQFLRLGDFRATLPGYLEEGQPSAAFVHADIGSGDERASVRLAADLAPILVKILASRGYLACDQPLEQASLEKLTIPGVLDGGRYHFYRSRG